MNLELQPGTYVVAVSGGVDSVVLLALLVERFGQRPGYTFIVAHFDHGIRPDSAADRRFVQHLAKRYDLPFVYEKGSLGPSASEATARTARYAFLRTVRAASGAAAILTAHHEDDALETAVINLLRGTGRKGLTALSSSGDIMRPLLGFTKAELQRYAATHQLDWREDSTNASDTYLRNYVRHHIIARLDRKERERLLGVVKTMRVTNVALDALLGAVLTRLAEDGKLNRRAFIMLPHKIAREVMAAWLRHHGVADFDSKTIERAVHAAKTYQHAKRTDITAQTQLSVGKDYLALEDRER
jgi:tRNA(Ile)-lysidine synthase